MNILLCHLELRDFVRQINQLQQQFGGIVAENIPVEENSPETNESLSAEVNNDSEISGVQLSLFNQSITPIKNTLTKVAQTAAESVQAATETILSQSQHIQPQIIDTTEKLNQLVATLKTYTNPDRPVAWDTETTTLEPRDAELVGIGCCWGQEPNQIAYIPIGHTTGNQLELSQVLEALQPILASNDYPKALQNTKFDRLIFRCQGI